MFLFTLNVNVARFARNVEFFFEAQQSYISVEYRREFWAGKWKMEGNYGWGYQEQIVSVADTNPWQFTPPPVDED